MCGLRGLNSPHHLLPIDSGAEQGKDARGAWLLQVPTKGPYARWPWNPTLRKVREGWGIPGVVYASEIKSLGHLPIAILLMSLQLPIAFGTVMC